MSYDRKQKQEKFTPGKWTAEKWEGGSKDYFVKDEKGETICDVYDSAQYTERAKSDASLIAAAPEMYYTLKELVLNLRQLHHVKNEFEFNRRLLEMISTAEDTLKKARGEK